MLQDRIQQVRAKIAELITKYEAAHPGQKVPAIDIRFDLRGRVAGQAGQRGWKYFMRFNTGMMQNDSWNHIINDTVPHELAHIICFANGNDRGHGWAWRRTCRDLGGSGNTYHREAVVYAKGETYVYTTSTGHTVNLSAVRHRKVQAGTGYSFRDGMGRIDRTSRWVVHGQQDQAVVAPVQNVLENKRESSVAASRKLSNAAQVRVWIRERREQGKTYDQIHAEVLSLAVNQLGQSVALARQYLRTEWNK